VAFFQSGYAFKNISSESLSLVKYGVKLMSSSSECIIFLYLGMEIFQSFELNLSFLCWSLLLCFIIRFIVIFGLSFLINNYQCSEENISFQEQFIMSYAGLRGAMSFSLVLMIDQDLFQEARMFKSTTLIIILFTVFVQGVLEHVENAIEVIATAGSKKTWLRNFDKRYLQYYLIKTQAYNTMESENGNENISDHFINLLPKTSSLDCL
jgi:NhaP-type Na+/H+ or K+/H+ antiporter